MAITGDNVQSRSSEEAIAERRKTDWENAMSALSAAAAAKASPDTMVGLALGKMLSKYLFPEQQLQALGGSGGDVNTTSTDTTSGAHLDTSKLQPTSDYALLGALGQDSKNQGAQGNPILQYGDPTSSLYGMALQEEGLKNPDGTYNMEAKYKFTVPEILSGR